MIGILAPKAALQEDSIKRKTIHIGCFDVSIGPPSSQDLNSLSEDELMLVEVKIDEKLDVDLPSPDRLTEYFRRVN